MSEAERTGVVLGHSVSGGGLLRVLLEGACAAFPSAFRGLSLPAPRTLRARIAELLPRFELARRLLRSRAPGPGQVSVGDQCVSAGAVSAQGLSHLLAEYVAKRLAAEAFSAYGSALVDTDEVSANDAEAHGSAPTRDSAPRAGSLAVRAPLGVTPDMLPVSATRSLAHPRLAAAVLGAPRFDMLIAAPPTAAAVGASLLVQTVVEPAPAQPADARTEALFSRQFHGGMLAQPFALESLVRMAALRGIAQQPSLALELLR